MYRLVYYTNLTIFLRKFNKIEKLGAGRPVIAGGMKLPGEKASTGKI
jgi:hypothetical protein